MTYLLALDQGTSSSRSIVFDEHGYAVSSAQAELPQHYPQPAWVEHDPLDIWRSQLETARQALRQASLDANRIRAIGITNQRETTLLWNRHTGQPLHRALVWQDRRTEAFCAALRDQGQAPLIREKTGLVLDAYFSAPKLRWLLDHVAGARDAAERGELAFGTIDTWLIWQLTQGRVHATDVSNASRTLLFDIERNDWSDELLGLFNIPRSVLPEVRPSAADYGTTAPELFGQPIRIAGVAGDQQSALFGQACHRPGQVKNTYGTGCFMLMHTGDQRHTSRHGLITTRAAQPSADAQYALEGSVFIGGAVVQWLRDGLRCIRASTEIEALAASVPDSDGVVFVPAFGGLGAPYWEPEARGTITGLTRGATAAHIARAALESIAFQSTALLRAMRQDAEQQGLDIHELRVDGGACVNNLLMQFQADLLGIPVVRPAHIETTALGAAYLAGIGSGLYLDLDTIAARWRTDAVFTPVMSRDQAEGRMAQWEHAVRQATAR